MTTPIYIDACIAIYAVEAATEHGPAVTALMNEHRSQAEFCVSDLVRLECRVRPLRDESVQLLEEYDRFFSMMTTLSIPTAAYDLAAELRAFYRLKTPDALHAAVAIHHGCAEFWTNDNRLGRLSDRIQVRILPGNG